MARPDEMYPLERLDYADDIGPILTDASYAYQIGNFEEYTVKPVGYEDVNLVVTTDRGRFFCKIFASNRTDTVVQRYVEIMENVVNADVNHPNLHLAGNSYTYQDARSGISMVMMDYIDGETFYDQARSPSDLELQKILAQAVKINALDYRPDFVEDTWSISHIEETYNEVKDRLNTKDKKLVEKVISDVQSIDVSILPHCFVHGDLTKSNVLQAQNGDIHIIDFSVANWYPRIQELAVIVGNLLNDGVYEETFLDTLKKVVEGYVKAGGVLTVGEMNAFAVYARAAYAMEFLGATREKVLKGDNSAENKFWLNLGRKGLQRK